MSPTRKGEQIGVRRTEAVLLFEYEIADAPMMADRLLRPFHPNRATVRLDNGAITSVELSGPLFAKSGKIGRSWYTPVRVAAALAEPATNPTLVRVVRAAQAEAAPYGLAEPEGVLA